MARKARVVRTEFPAGRRVLAVSDIHGNLPFLKGVLAAAGYGRSDILVLVGDLVEKGPDSLATLRYIMDLAEKGAVYCLRGNCDNLVPAFVAERGAEERFYRFYLSVWGERSLLLQMGRSAGLSARGPEDLPALRAAVEERFAPELAFLSAMPEVLVTPYKVNGKYHTRYRNPSGHRALQRSEIRAFKRYSEAYLSPFCTEQKVVFYTYFSVFPRLITSDEDEALYYRYIDNFKALGGNMIIFNPIERFVQPVPTNDSRWVIAKEGTRAANILRYCREKGIGYGFTWGSAVINTNSPMTSYTLIGEKNGWKKIGKGGELGRENCLACEDFYQWFKAVQVNTIREEGIELWDWDPGPGIASFCYSAEHGHIPGKGLYKGFRNAMRIIAEMKEACPGLKIQSFHGNLINIV